MWRVGFFGKKLVYNCNKRGVEDGKNLRNQYTWMVEMCVEGGFLFFGGRNFSKSVSVTPRLLDLCTSFFQKIPLSTFIPTSLAIREMRVYSMSLLKSW